MACTPATAAPAGSFSPMRRATMAVVERLNPRPIAKTRLRSDSVRPTVATASAPRRPTQKTSTTAKRDSRTISMTMGMARRRMARLRLPVVKSWCEPRRASRMELHKEGDGATAAVRSSDIKTLTFYVSALRDANARTRLRRLIERNGRDDQFRASGGLPANSDLRGEHGRCPWRCLCELTAPELRISMDLIGTTRFYLERVPRSYRKLVDEKSSEENKTWRVRLRVADHPEGGQASQYKRVYQDLCFFNGRMATLLACFSLAGLREMVR